ncbi:MAG: MYG1 family protein [Spirochaetales bacterium]|nr:MYG1 family protein [Spirochaetales bacterium]
MSYKIIIHDGKAHMDELLGCALLALHLQEEPESIERINPQDAALLVKENKVPNDTYVIDCGLVFDSSRKLFDHHHDKDCPCSALLIFNEFYPDLKDSELHSYMELVSKVDTRGPMSLEDFGIATETKDYFSFSQEILLRSFEENPMNILKIFIAGLNDKIKFLKAKEEAAKWFKSEGNIEITSVEEINILRYLQVPPSELVSPLRSVSGKIVDDNNIAATFSFDDKNPEARTLYRTDTGHELLDFSKCSPSNTIFNHPSGFLMKFVPEHDEEWIDLLKTARIK